MIVDLGMPPDNDVLTRGALEDTFILYYFGFFVGSLDPEPS